MPYVSRKITESDLPSVQGYLWARKRECMFLCGNLESSGLVYKDEPFHGEYWGVFQGSICTGILGHFWNGNVMTIAESDSELQQLATIFGQEATRAVAGFIGLEHQCRSLIKLMRFQDARFSLDNPEGLYALSLADLNPHPLQTREKVVPASAVDAGVLFKWMKAYGIEALRAEDDSALETSTRARVQSFLESGDVFVLLKEDIPVCLSGFNSKFQDVVQVGPVWTPPEHRGSGYAKRLLSETLVRVRQGGAKEAVLFTYNAAAVRVYESVGFRRIGSYLLAFLAKAVKL